MLAGKVMHLLNQLRCYSSKEAMINEMISEIHLFDQLYYYIKLIVQQVRR